MTRAASIQAPANDVRGNDAPAAVPPTVPRWGRSVFGSWCPEDSSCFYSENINRTVAVVHLSVACGGSEAAEGDKVTNRLMSVFICNDRLVHLVLSV